MSLTGDIVEQWKTSFQALLNNVNMPSVEDAETRDSVAGLSIILADLTKSKRSSVARHKKVDEVHPAIGLFFADKFRQHCIAERWFPFLNREPRGCFFNNQGSLVLEY